jgi:hypothetical protein
MIRRHQNRGPVFVLKLRPIRSDADSIRGLRAILKSLLRRHGFRCVDAPEEQSTTPNEGVEDA